MTYNEEIELAKHSTAMKIWKAVVMEKMNAYSQSQSVMKADSVVDDFYTAFKSVNNG